jgi:hypothetical protein
MGLHLITFAVGAAAGSLVTYIYKDKSNQKKIKNAAQNVTDKVKTFVKRDKVDDVIDDAADLVDAEPAS